jgi:hypothetical protein
MSGADLGRGARANLEPVLVALSNGDVFVIVPLVVLPIAAIAFIGAGAALRQIGKGQFAIEQDLPQKTMGVARPASREVREAEVRQMLEAKSYRQVARGEQPLDVDAEVERIMEQGTAPPRMDRALREEVRQHVEAQNERRARRGQEPLDVEAEVERQLGAHSEPLQRSRDAELREEVRQLVVARNERRMRRGEPPLDITQEVERQLRELENLGQ